MKKFVLILVLLCGCQSNVVDYEIDLGRPKKVTTKDVTQPFGGRWITTTIDCENGSVSYSNSTALVVPLDRDVIVEYYEDGTSGLYFKGRERRYRLTYTFNK